MLPAAARGRDPEAGLRLHAAVPEAQVLRDQWAKGGTREKLKPSVYPGNVKVRLLLTQPGRCRQAVPVGSQYRSKQTICRCMPLEHSKDSTKLI